MITCGDCFHFEDNTNEWGYCTAPLPICALINEAVKKQQAALFCPCLLLKTCESCKYLAGIGDSLWCGIVRNKPVDEWTTCKRWRRSNHG